MQDDSLADVYTTPTATCMHSLSHSLTATLTSSPGDEGGHEANTGMFRNWSTGAEPSTTIKIRINMYSDLYD